MLFWYSSQWNEKSTHSFVDLCLIPWQSRWCHTTFLQYNYSKYTSSLSVVWCGWEHTALNLYCCPQKDNITWNATIHFIADGGEKSADDVISEEAGKLVKMASLSRACLFVGFYTFKWSASCKYCWISLAADAIDFCLGTRILMHTMKQQISEGKLQKLDSFEVATTS